MPVVLAATEYTRANTVWAFLALGVVCLLFAFASPTFKWCVDVWKKRQRRLKARRASSRTLKLTGYASTPHRGRTN